jgi:hypothetical protein
MKERKRMTIKAEGRADNKERKRMTTKVEGESRE